MNTSLLRESGSVTFQFYILIFFLILFFRCVARRATPFTADRAVGSSTDRAATETLSAHSSALFVLFYILHLNPIDLSDQN